MRLRLQSFANGAARLRRFALAGALATVAAGGVLYTATEQAFAGDHRKVCREKAYVRNFPKGWAWSQLYKNQTFEVYEYSPGGEVP